MALKIFDGTMTYGVDTATGILHAVALGANGAITDIVPIVSNIGATPTIDIGEVGILNSSNTQINPAKEDGNLATLAGTVNTGAMQVKAVSGATFNVTASAGTNLNTSALALETGGNLATIVTDLAPLVAGGGGGYIRQDSTATIAKESGGNLATLATASVQDTGTDTELGQQRLTMAGVAQSATIPATTTKVILAAEGGDIRYSLASTATATSGGYLPQGSLLVLRVVSASTLSVYGGAGAFANLEYLKRS